VKFTLHCQAVFLRSFLAPFEVVWVEYGLRYGPFLETADLRSALFSEVAGMRLEEGNSSMTPEFVCTLLVEEGATGAL